MKKWFVSLVVLVSVLIGSLPVMADGYYQEVTGRVPVYMFYSYSVMDYLMTASVAESVKLQKEYNTGKSTYEYQGIVGYAIPDLSKEGLKTEDYFTDAVPVYRFFNQETCDHFYTTSEAEKEATEKAYKNKEDNYKYEGVAFYVPEYSGRPVYRFFDVRNMSHFWTMDDNTAQDLKMKYQQGTGTYRYEGIAWYWFDRNA